MTRKNHLVCLGFGFSARHLAARLDHNFWHITATFRSAESAAKFNELGLDCVDFDAPDVIAGSVTHILSSVPPDLSGDPVLLRFSDSIRQRAPNIRWAGYLSTTGVYGDHGGAWVDEETPLAPNTERAVRRVQAEAAWTDLSRESSLPLHIFRLAGIYGPGRNTLENLRDGTAKRVVKPGQVFSRIHVEDIAGVLEASMARPDPGRIYNVADDEPCPPQDVVAFGAQLLGIDPPPEIRIEDAQLSTMAQSFFADSKRVCNARIKKELSYKLRYPNYRIGLKSLI